MEETSWNRFIVTGSVEDYLSYKRKCGQDRDGSQQESDRVNKTGEEAVWEKPLR